LAKAASAIQESGVVATLNTTAVIVTHEDVIIELVDSVWNCTITNTSIVASAVRERLIYSAGLGSKI